MSFFVELWDSVFTPGTTPALILATHVSFICLIISLIFLIYLSRSIHFINLLAIAVLLYGAVVWFINELKTIKLKENEELEKEKDSSETGEKDEPTKKDATATGVQRKAASIKRKT